MDATDLLLGLTALSEAAYLILDGFTNIARKDREMTGRRIAVVSLLSLIGSTILGVLVVQVSEDVPAFEGALLTAVWSALLAFVWFCSWRLYHSMLEYSGRVQSEKMDTVEFVERRTAETLAPMGEKVGKIEGIADALKTSIEQWNQKAPATLDAMKKASDATRRSSEWVFDWIENTKKDMGQIASRYEELAEAHRNDSATIYLVSNKLESLVERASILQDEIDELLAEGASAPEEEIDDDSPGGSSAGAGTPRGGSGD